jgi:hypothetical protein
MSGVASSVSAISSAVVESAGAGSVYGCLQPAVCGGRVVIDERENLAGSHRSRSISSSCGITIYDDHVFEAVVSRQAQPFRRHHNQFEGKRRRLLQDRPDGALCISPGPLDRHDHGYFQTR